MSDHEHIRRRLAKSLIILATGIGVWSQSAIARDASHPVSTDRRIAQADTKPAGDTKPADAPSPANAPAASTPAAPPAAAPAAPPPAPAAAPPAPAQQPAAKGPATETPAVVMNGQQVASVLSKKVRGADGTDMGRIVDIIADKAGQLRAAIIDFGGFLGVGSRQIAVDWDAIRFPADGKSDWVEVDLTRDQLRGAPAYKPGEQIVVLGKPAAGARPPRPSADAAEPAKSPATK